MDEAAKACIEINERVLLPAGPILRDTLGQFVQKVDLVKKDFTERKN